MIEWRHEGFRADIMEVAGMGRHRILDACRSRWCRAADPPLPAGLVAERQHSVSHQRLDRQPLRGGREQARFARSGPIRRIASRKCRLPIAPSGSVDERAPGGRGAGTTRGKCIAHDRREPRPGTRAAFSSGRTPGGTIVGDSLGAREPWTQSTRQTGNLAHPETAVSLGVGHRLHLNADLAYKFLAACSIGFSK